MAGIVRRIDELGRIVIPKELRRTMLIREGEQLEMAQLSQTEIIVRKFSQLQTVADKAKEYCKIASNLIGKTVLAVDKSQVLATSSPNAEYVGDSISTMLYSTLAKGEEYYTDDMQVIKRDVNDYQGVSVYPIKSDGEVYGGMVVLGSLSGEGLGAMRAVVSCISEGLTVENYSR